MHGTAGVVDSEGSEVGVNGRAIQASQSEDDNDQDEDDDRSAEGDDEASERRASEMMCDR